MSTSLPHTEEVDVELCAGLYTSPHLVAVRERIRINGAPLSEEQFSNFFFDVWDRLEQHDKVRGA